MDMGERVMNDAEWLGDALASLLGEMNRLGAAVLLETQGGGVGLNGGVGCCEGLWGEMNLCW